MGGRRNNSTKLSKNARKRVYNRKEVVGRKVKRIKKHKHVYDEQGNCKGCTL